MSLRSRTISPAHNERFVRLPARPLRLFLSPLAQ
jgi:hypothetical protein